MKRQVITLLSLIFVCSSSGKSTNIFGFSNSDFFAGRNNPQNLNATFCTAYPEACAAFDKNYIESKTLYESVIKQQWKLDVAKVISIASPEIAIYSSSLDKIETLASETFYVQLGEDYANFSIGTFQMKPSFIRELETAIKKETFDFKPPVDISLGQTDDEKSRRVRIQRIADPVWQLHYLCAFYAVMEAKTRKKKFDSESDRISYYAAAYNTGFQKSEQDIEKIRLAKLFPRKLPGRTERFAYGDVAKYFYGNLVSKN